MSDFETTPEEQAKDAAAWEVEVSKGSAKEFFESISDEASKAGAEVLIARADMIFGLDHIRTALYHARRSLSEGSNSSDSLSMETLLYASGERQLNSAIKKMSVDNQTRQVVVAKLSGRFQPHPGWRPLGNVEPESLRERLIKFGITERELQTIGKAEDLVLEKVAAVDVLKK